MEVIVTMLNFTALKTKGRKAFIAFSNREFGNLAERSLVEKWRQREIAMSRRVNGK